MFPFLGAAQGDIIVPQGYEKVPVNLNEGGVNKGDKVWLLFQRDATSSAITDIYILEDQEPIKPGYRKIGTISCLTARRVSRTCFHSCASGVACPRLLSADINLSKYGGGVPLYVAYRKDMPVLSVKLSSTGERGFEYIDRNLRATSSGGP